MDTTTIHSLIASRPSTLLDVMESNDYQFVTLPDLLFIRLQKTPQRLIRFFPPLMVDCPLTDFKIKTVSGEVRTYDLTATVETVDGHAFSHVLKGKQWYMVNNAIAVKILAKYAVTETTSILFYRARV